MPIGFDIKYMCLFVEYILMLQKPVLEKPSTTLGELENSGLLRGTGPEELTLQALSHKQKVTEFLYMDRHD